MHSNMKTYENEIRYISALLHLSKHGEGAQRSINDECSTWESCGDTHSESATLNVACILHMTGVRNLPV